MCQWIIGAIMGFLSLFGLFLAGNAHDGMFAFFGFMLCAFGLIAIFTMIHRATATPPSDH